MIFIFLLRLFQMMDVFAWCFFENPFPLQPPHGRLFPFWRRTGELQRRKGTEGDLNLFGIARGGRRGRRKNDLQVVPALQNFAP